MEQEKGIVLNTVYIIIGAGILFRKIYFYI